MSWTGTRSPQKPPCTAFRVGYLSISWRQERPGQGEAKWPVLPGGEMTPLYMALTSASRRGEGLLIGYGISGWHKAPGEGARTTLKVLPVAGTPGRESQVGRGLDLRRWQGEPEGILRKPGTAFRAENHQPNLPARPEKKELLARYPERKPVVRSARQALLCFPAGQRKRGSQADTPEQEKPLPGAFPPETGSRWKQPGGQTWQNTWKVRNQ